MGKLTPEIFNESCCDGGACNTQLSAQSCGCDPGINWTCERHRYRLGAFKLLTEWRTLMEQCEDSGMKAVYACCAMQLEKTLI